MKSWLWFILAVFGFITGCSPPGPRIRIKEAWIRPDPLMENAAGYLLIQNDGSEPDWLTGVQVEFSTSATLHQSMMEGDVHRMEPVDRLEIPAGGEVSLQPLSYHVMMIGLRRNLEIGEMVTLTLVFEHTGELRVEGEVRLGE